MQISKKCSVAIHCLVLIHEFGQKDKITSELLSLSSGSNAVTIRNILSALKKEGIVSIRPGTGGATLRCPPEQITLYRVCAAIEPDFLKKLMGIHAAPSPFCPVGRNIHAVLDCSYGKLREDLHQSMQRITLADILGDYHRELSRETEKGRTGQ